MRKVRLRGIKSIVASLVSKMFGSFSCSFCLFPFTLVLFVLFRFIRFISLHFHFILITKSAMLLRCKTSKTNPLCFTCKWFFKVSHWTKNERRLHFSKYVQNYSIKIRSKISSLTYKSVNDKKEIEYLRLLMVNKLMVSKTIKR